MTHNSGQITAKLILFSLLLQFPCETIEEPTNPKLSYSQAASVLMVGFRGVEIDRNNTLIQDLIKFRVGGVILFDYDVPSKSYGRNITEPEQLKRLTTELKKAYSEPLLIAVDQEGGKVNRLKARNGFSVLPSQAKIAASFSRRYSDSLYNNQAKVLSEYGFNVNFAPVVDLNINPDNPIIGKLERSFGVQPDTVIKYASSAIEAYSKYHILPVLKHFPGHGSSHEDSHLGVVNVSEYWTNLELLPFQKLVDQYQNIGIMTAHIYNNQLDKRWPATLSESVIQKQLRDSLGFIGLIFSDDLQMDAIREEYDLKTTIRQALLAGIDVLVFGNNSVYDEKIIRNSTEIIIELAEEDHRIYEQVLSAQKKIKKVHQQLSEGS